MAAAAEEQRVVLVGEAPGPGLDFRFEFEHLVDGDRQMAQLVDIGGFLFRRQTFLELGDDQGQHEQRGELGGEGPWSRRRRFPGPARGDEAQRAVADDGRFRDVADGQRLLLAECLGVAQGGQGVGGLAGLRDGNDELARVGHRSAIAVFAGDLDIAGHAGDGFEPVAGGETGMAAGAAGENEDGIDIGEQVGRRGAEDAGLDALAAADDFQRIGQRFRLFEDFLLHVVLVIAEFDGGGGKLRNMYRPADRRAVEAGDLDAVRGQFGDVAVFQVNHVARHLEQGRGIGGGVVAGIGNAEQQGRTLAGDNDLAGLLLVDDGDREGADQAAAGDLHGREQIGLVLQRGLDQVGDAFGVGIGGEDVAQRAQFAAQAFVILDDAVMDDGDIARDMRVGVLFARHAVCRPARVGDASDGRYAGRRRFEFGDTTGRADALDGAVADDGQAGRVITPIFELLQAFDQYGNNVVAGGGCDDSTHISC